MLSIKEILAAKPSFILAVDYNSGSIGEMTGEDRDLNLYIAEMTIQHHSLVGNACLSFMVECLVSVNDNKVTIEDMNTSSDHQSIYTQNIDGLQAIDSFHTFVYVDSIDEDLRDLLIVLIESQPIYDIPNHFIIEAY